MPKLHNALARQIIENYTLSSCWPVPIIIFFIIISAVQPRTSHNILYVYLYELYVRCWRTFNVLQFLCSCDKVRVEE